MLDASASGVYVIAVTPFHDDGRLDDASAERMVAFYRGCGVTGLTILGVMGEAPKLDTEEATGFSRRVIKGCGRLPVIVGVSAAGFAAMRVLAHSVMDAGAAGVMIAPPAAMRTDDQIVGYFAQAVESIGADVPFVIQDYPQGSGVVMAPSAPRSISKSRNTPPLPANIDTRRIVPSSTMRRSAESFSSPGQSSAFSITQDACDSTMLRIADGAITTPVPCG